jgi:hypothetical protein
LIFKKSYPNRLIPNKNDKMINIQPEILKHFLGHWISKDTPLKEADNYLNPMAIDVKRLSGFSNNKIPGSAVKDLNICILQKYKKSLGAHWIEGSSGIKPQWYQFQYDNSRQHFFMRIGDLHNYSDKYTKPSGSTNEYKFTLIIIHVPLNSNFFHFEFKFLDKDSEEIKKIEEKGWTKAISASIMDHVQHCALFNPEIVETP